MALQKVIDLGNGFEASYIKVRSISINLVSTHMEIFIDIYKDKDARDSLKNPVTSKSINIDVTDNFDLNWLNIENNNIIKFAYIVIKNTSDFSDAIDV